MLTINAGPEMAKVLEQTRRSINDLKTSVRRVSSGIRIESAGDDPGAIGSVTLAESAISGVQRTLRNLNEGITVTQALTDDLSLVEELLITLREVAEQATSSNYTDTERAELQVQAKNILGKIDEAIHLAGAKDGVELTSNSRLTISGSPELSLNTQLVITDLLVDELGKRVIYSSQRSGVFTSAFTEGALRINGIGIRPTTTDDDTRSTTASDGSAIAKANAINAATYLTGVTAQAGPTEAIGNRPVSAIDLTGLNYLSVNGSVITGVSVGELDSVLSDQAVSATGALREAINDETKYTGVSATLDDSGQLVLRAEDGRNIYVKYSSQEVLNAIGVTDKEGDVPNLSGAVRLASPDRDLRGEVQTPITTNFQTYSGANVSVNGRFDASEDYIDIVANVTKSGGFGVAEFRLGRDSSSELNAAEDFSFIEGTVSATLNTTGVLGDFFTTGGVGSGRGSYNEALDREYILTATQEGTTDGSNRAEFQVSTAQDGVVGTFTASALSEINIAGSRTGEDVTIYLGNSTRNSTLTSTIAAGQEYDRAITLGGAYNGAIDSNTTVEVITSGRTQGASQAQVQVYHDGAAYNGLITVNADVPIDLGRGQTLTFAADLPTLSSVTATVTGTYAETVTIASTSADYTGIGAATYEVEVTQEGAVDNARYIVNKDGVQVGGEALLNQGIINVADGITFNVPDAPPARRFAVGDTFSVDVNSEHLQQGSLYTVSNTLGKFLVGDTLKLNTTHAFQAPTYVVENSVSILDGLTLDFAQDGAFEIGDEVRFQVRGYTGDPIASGTYSYAISPTTFTVEVTNTGDVDGGVATFQYTRADTGETVGGLGVSSGAIELDDGVEIAFTAGRVYAGDQFTINTFESLEQTFGGALTLSSNHSVTIDFNDTEIDNLLGRIAYSGTTPRAPGVDGNATSALLAPNRETAVGNVDVSTQERAQRSVVYTDNARESLSQYKRRVALTQATFEDLSNHLGDDLTLKLDNLERIIKANPQEEGERAVKAVRYNESNNRLAAFAQQAAANTVSLIQQSLIAPEPPKPREIKPVTTPTQSEKAARGKKKIRGSAEERTAAQQQARRESVQRLEKMMSAVESAQRRSATAVVSLGALRQLSQAYIDVSAADDQRVRANVSDPAVSSTTPNVSSSVRPATGSTPPRVSSVQTLAVSDRSASERAAVRDAEEALNEARSYLQDMKAVTLEVQATTNSVDLESQQAELDELIVELRNLELPIAGLREAQEDTSTRQGGRADLSRLQFSSAVSRALGSFSSEESASGVDTNLPLSDGSLVIITARQDRVAVRGTRPSDDADSTRQALGSARAKAGAINASSARHGVVAIAGPTVAMSAGAVSEVELKRESLLRINGVEVSGINVQARDNDGVLRDAINAVSDRTGVSATSTRGGGLRLIAADGRNIVVDAYGDATRLGLTPRGAGVAESSTTGGALTLSSRDSFTLELDDVRGGQERPLGALSATPLTRSIERLDLTTRQSRADTLSVIELALGDLDTLRRALGLA